MKKSDWNQNGFVVLPDLLTSEEVSEMKNWYQKFLDNEYDLSGYRSDLSGEKNEAKTAEKITQIMRPSMVDSRILELPIYGRLNQIAKEIEGDDMEMDFDMLINKFPLTDAETPWHQDAAYWPQLDDKRAVSFWVALDDVDQENGCMMYVPESQNLEILPHTQANANGALKCSIPEESEIFHGVLSAGSAIGHHGHTLHGALGNTSPTRSRRAWIVNYRPTAMITKMRNQGYNHLGKRSQKAEK